MGAVHPCNLDCTQTTRVGVAEQHDDLDDWPTQDNSSGDARCIRDPLHTSKIETTDDQRTDVWPHHRRADSHSSKMAITLAREWATDAQSVSSANRYACLCTPYTLFTPAPTLLVRRHVFARTDMEGNAPVDTAQTNCFVQGRLCEARGTVGLTTIAECFQPLMLEIAGYLVSSAREYVLCFLYASPAVSASVVPYSQMLWKQMYMMKWHAFYDFLAYQGTRDWHNTFRDTLAGSVECTLEIFDREKKVGFAMAAMSAQVSYEYKTNAFITRYISASEVDPEHIPMAEAHRLRFCPPSARPQLQPRKYSEEHAEADLYPHRVLQGLGDLVVGSGVEVQWKMQYESPFGWWYGHLEQLHRDVPSPGLATASITFPHFETNSMWYRLHAIVGDDQMRECSFGGYTGGLRGVTDEENKVWMQFLPNKPLVF